MLNTLQSIITLKLPANFFLNKSLNVIQMELQQAYSKLDKTGAIEAAYQHLQHVMTTLNFEPTELHVLPQINLSQFSFKNIDDIIFYYEQHLIDDKNQDTSLFLQLGYTLQLQLTSIVDTRKQQLQEFQQQHVLSWLILQYRIQLISLFGQENLSDFEYRKALATGEIAPIISYYKLLSPLKWLAALVNTVLLPLQFLKEIPSRLSEYLIEQWKWYFKNPQPEFMHQLLRRACATSIVLIYLINGYLCLVSKLPYIFYLANFVVYADVLNLLANPINQLVVPLANKLDCSALFAGALVMSAFIGMYFLCPVLQMMELGSRVYMLFAIYNLTQSITQIDNRVHGYTQLSSILLMINKFDSLQSIEVIPQLAKIWSFLEYIFQCSKTGLNYQYTAKQHALECMLPLNNFQEAEHDIQVVVNQHCKPRRFSQLFFNTPSCGEPIGLEFEMLR